MRFQVRKLCLLLLTLTSAAQQPGKTNMFAFHNGFWINLHHFLYRQAQVSAPQKGPHPLSLNKADEEELQLLSRNERATWNEAVVFYSRTIVKHDLLFDDELIQTKDALEDAESSPDLANIKINADLKATLLQAAPIYRKHWWPRHNTKNQAWIAHLEPLVQLYGTTLSTRMSKIYNTPWPSTPVRVDTVAYANWAGAYTTLEPTRPTISTTDPANQGTAVLEILFHEASHGMMDKVMDAIKSAEADINAHRPGAPFHSASIWHAILFYTAGELVSEQVPGHVPYADKNGLWDRAWPSPDRALIEADWKPHMQGTITLQQSTTKLLNDLAKQEAKP